MRVRLLILLGCEGGARGHLLQEGTGVFATYL